MFLRSLHEEQLLQFNIGVFKWTWDMEAANAKLATENVATMLKSISSVVLMVKNKVC